MALSVKRILGTTLAVLGGILMILAALYLPTFSRLDINTSLVDTSRLSQDQRNMLENRTNVAGVDTAEYMDEAAEVEEMRPNADAMRTFGNVLSLLFFMTVIFGVVVIILGFLAKRWVRPFGYGGVIFGIVMVVVVWLIPDVSDNYILAELGLGPVVSFISGVMVIGSSFCFPKKGHRDVEEGEEAVAEDEAMLREEEDELDYGEER
jgi:hypothetical protein